MSSLLLLALAIGIGVIAGLRSLTAPAVVGWAAHLRWITIPNAHLALLGTRWVVLALSLLAIVELVIDKLPSTPNRTAPGPMIGRLLTGGLSGAALCAAADQSVFVGAILGGIGALLGTFGGFHLRSRLVKIVGAPDVFIALIEDAVAIGGAFLLVSRL